MKALPEQMDKEALFVSHVGVSLTICDGHCRVDFPHGAGDGVVFFVFW